ncbi:FAD binding domain-containing protein [Pochonia chlamydosporia 170]|uniref:FAD binding domain-containing protein n=1 Tax=Pochonia chlamydosporia 170 TaxID=1380566 RepID=A0A179F4I8_METCM|nr:FAD binding domain-containing protein [Pochonia chlamydosporia 170]OAQ60322.1 FAD binding domain-containing protein [Pochonia chlamydosporia 170]
MPEQFVVAIVGAGIAGLTLANFLEKLNIEFLLLEAKGEIAPPIGACFGWQPHGLRIFDQLGCCEEMLAVSEVSTTHGYPITITPRHSAIRVLYEHLQHRDRVILGQRIVNAEQSGDKVFLHAESGRIFEADIAVGADGVHSMVRRAMAKMAMESKIEARIELKTQCEYECIFGVSRPTGDLKSSQSHITRREAGPIITVIVGPNDTPSWFLWFKLPEDTHGVNIPRFTAEDELALAEQESEMYVSANVKFKDLYKNVIFSRTTALPIHASPTWHFGRFVLIGDSVHKFDPVTGHGANSAVESAAALADNLSAMMTSRNHLSAEDIESVFSQTALLRTERVAWLVEESARFQRYLSYTNFAAQVLFFRLVPLLETRVVTDFFSKRMFSGYRSKALPNPNLNKKVAHSVPYVDELLAEPKSDSCLTRIAIVAYMALLYFALSRQDVPIDGKWPSPLARAMQPSTFILPDAASNSLLFVSCWLTTEVAIQMTLVTESRRPRNRLALFSVAYLHGLISGFCSITATCCLTFLLDNIGTDGRNRRPKLLVAVCDDIASCQL